MVFFLFAVMELRARAEIGWVDPDSFVEMFVAGRAKLLFPLMIWLLESFGVMG